MTDVKQILNGVLDVVGFTGDKEKWTNEFIQNCKIQALADIVKEFPSDKQSQLSQLKPEEIKQRLEQEISKEQMDKAIEAAAQKGMTIYLDGVIPTLDQTRFDKLKEYLVSFNLNPAA